jgi:hypothetical protein
MNWRIRAGLSDYGGLNPDNLLPLSENAWTMYLTCFEFAINAMVMGYGVT